MHVATSSVSGAIDKCRRLGRGTPVHHCRYRQAPPLGRGVTSRPYMRYGQQIPLSGVAQGSSNTMLVRLALLETWVPRYSLCGRQSHRDASAPSLVLGAVPGPQPAFVAARGSGGPRGSPCPRPRPTPQPPDRARRNPLQGVRRDESRTSRVGRGGSFPWGLEHGWACTQKVGRRGARAQGVG
jgi:hypothetical protein